MKKRENRGQYAGFTLSDFIADPFFQDGVIHPGGEATAFWEDWVQQHTDKAELIIEARKLLQSLNFEEQVPADEQVQRSLSRARELIAEGVGKVVRLPLNRRSGSVVRGHGWNRRIGWAAAVIAGIGIATVAGYLSKSHRATQQTYSTQYAEMHTIYLPDSSRLVLNAHSTVHYAARWGPGQSREVWLEGEGYFDVRTDRASTFRVYTKDLTVEVLGTAFDIRNRRGKTEVVLETGKIKLRFPPGVHEDVVMTPGDRIISDPEKAVLAHTVTIPENYSSWKDGKLTEATVGEILEYLEDNYHKTFILEDPTLAREKIGGVILLDDLNDALFALSTVLNVNIIQKRDSIILKKR